MSSFFLLVERDKLFPTCLATATGFILLLVIEPLLRNPEYYVVTQAAIHFCIFSVIAHIPCYFTDVVWWVDMAWPTGIAASGIYNYYASGSYDEFTKGNTPSYKAEVVTFMYLFIGVRMMFGGLYYWLWTGEWNTKAEIQRYQYGRQKYEKHNPSRKWANWNMQAEISGQCYSDFAILNIPGVLICNDRNPTTSLEIAGFVVWVVAYVIENVGDSQKFYFIMKKAEAKVKGAVCNVGLWRYSRHPNYFGQWLGWAGISLMALQSVLNLDTSLEKKALIIFTLNMVPLLMFYTLVIWTGTKPAEAGSVKKRPGYKAYQDSTSMFFLWFPNQTKNSWIMRLQDWMLENM